MNVHATEVFTPGSFPERTYVERSGAHLEDALRDALGTEGQIVSLVGPSKSGKTVLVERVVGREHLITVTGVGINSPDDIWARVLDWMCVPAAVTQTSSTSGKVGTEASASASGGLLSLAKVSVKASGSKETSHERSTSILTARSGLSQVVRDIAKSDYVVLIDDFHYMPREVQSEAAKSLKEAARLGIKICTAAVHHRGDDLVRANPELRGRVRAVDLEYWNSPDLAKIATAGFTALNVAVGQGALETLTTESAGSPQLMQLLCLNTCFGLGVRERLAELTQYNVSKAQAEHSFEQTSASTDFRSLVDVIDAGPRTRGVERKIYTFSDGTKGDIYRCVLKAVAANPPMLSFAYDELTRRTTAVCAGESPVGSSISGTCLHMSRLALQRFPKERAIDWDEQKQVLDLPDPYLVFYLRWSNRLKQAE